MRRHVSERYGGVYQAVWSARLERERERGGARGQEIDRHTRTHTHTQHTHTHTKIERVCAYACVNERQTSRTFGSGPRMDSSSCWRESLNSGFCFLFISCKAPACKSILVGEIHCFGEEQTMVRTPHTCTRRQTDARRTTHDARRTQRTRRTLTCDPSPLPPPLPPLLLPPLPSPPPPHTAMSVLGGCGEPTTVASKAPSPSDASSCTSSSSCSLNGTRPASPRSSPTSRAVSRLVPSVYILAPWYSSVLWVRFPYLFTSSCKW